MQLPPFLLGLSLVFCTTGHYTFPKIALNGVDLGGEFEYIRRHTSGIVGLYTDIDKGVLNSTDLRCNRGGAAPNAATKTLVVTGGDKIAFKVESIGGPAVIDHPGPVFVYLSRAPDAASNYDGSGTWFKAFEAGLCPKNPARVNPMNDWCLNNRDRVDYTIPKTLPPGEYLARVEQLALHYSTTGQVQIYLSCAQIRVINTTVGQTPGPLVNIPVLYAKNDPGMIYDTNLFPNPNPYVMPGPKVWLG